VECNTRRDDQAKDAVPVGLGSERQIAQIPPRRVIDARGRGDALDEIAGELTWVLVPPSSDG